MRIKHSFFIGKIVYQLYQYDYQDIHDHVNYNNTKGEIYMQKIYKENGTNYFFTFNSEDLKNSFYAFLLKNNKEGEKRFTREELYEKLSKKLYISPEAVRKHISGSNAPNDIKVIYGYGEFLQNGDRYAFLKLHETDSTFNEKTQDVLAYDNFAEKCVKAVYSSLIKLISEYSLSDCFNRTPDDSDALLYYRRKVDRIESMVKQIHGHDALVDDLLSLVKDIKRMICTCDFPGVPKLWYVINPNLRFYTVGFAIISEAPEFYHKLKNGGTCFTLEYYPEESELEQCYEYFSELYKENEENNFHYNSSDFFQEELIKTIKLLFEKYINHHIKENSF